MFSIKLSTNSIEITASDEEAFNVALSKVESVANKANDVGIVLKANVTDPKAAPGKGPKHITPYDMR